MSRLTSSGGVDPAVLVGPEGADDAGVYLLGDVGLVATADLITPVCDDPVRFGRVAAANSLSDVYAMGGEPLFALNLCCFPGDAAPSELLSSILAGGLEIMKEAGAALLGGHTLRDPELKFGLSVIGRVEPASLLPNSAARAGDHLILTKPLGSGVLINAFKFDHLDAAGLEPALSEMERLNQVACRAALSHGVHAATDITGFGLAGHALEMARASGVALRLDYDRLPVFDGFFELVGRGITTGCTGRNRDGASPWFRDERGLDAVQAELLFDPQTSGGLLLATPAREAAALLEELLAGGHSAADIGVVSAGEPRLSIH